MIILNLIRQYAIMTTIRYTNQVKKASNDNQKTKKV